MELLNEEIFSKNIKAIINEAREILHPHLLYIYVTDERFWGAAGTGEETSNGDFIIKIHKDHLNEYVLSHELLHICSKRHGMVPMVSSINDNSLAELIAMALQSYLEHKWIISEQLRIGISIDDDHRFDDLLKHIEEKDFIQHIQKVLILNDMIRTHPELYMSRRDTYIKAIPRVVEHSERIMRFYSENEIYSIFEAKRITVKAIKELQKIFDENNVDIGNLSFTIIVAPVFSTSQMERMANASLDYIPNAIQNRQTGEIIDIICTSSDGQCCGMFLHNSLSHATETALRSLKLSEFVEKTSIPFHIR